MQDVKASREKLHQHANLQVQAKPHLCSIKHNSCAANRRTSITQIDRPHGQSFPTRTPNRYIG